MFTPRGHVLLDIDTPDQTISYLKEQKWISDNEEVKMIVKAGEGNMNCTLRVISDQRPFILKQSRAWVEKYPQIAAPEARLLIEAAFYEAVATVPAVAGRMPGLLNVDRINRIAQFQDLGDAADYTFLYNDADTTLDSLPGLCEWLSALHAVDFPDDVKTGLQNNEMRALNHEHFIVSPWLRTINLTWMQLRRVCRQRVINSKATQTI